MAAVLAVLSAGVAGCAQVNDPAARPADSTLRIGFGLTTGADSRAGGIRQVVMNFSSEGLITYAPDGRPQPRLAESWSLSDDGLLLSLKLTAGVSFHDGTPVTAALVRDILLRQMPSFVGPALDDIEKIDATSDTELQFQLRRRSTFILEGLDAPILTGAGDPVGTGPFTLSGEGEDGSVRMTANAAYYRGRPGIDNVVVQPYSSVRSAWASLLRQEVDMVYEVGVDAVDLLQPSTNINVYSSARPYALAVILNVRRPQLRDPAIRRALNAAVDRTALVADALNGHGIPAESPLWPYHWASREGLPRFGYAPAALEQSGITVSILFAEESHERVALMLQRQLQAIGVNVVLEAAPLDEAVERLTSGNFDGFLVDAIQGPVMVRPYLMWHSKAPRNWGGFASAEVDAAFEAIQRAPSDDAYREGVAAFQHAMVNDPPAIFLAWGERSRAVSARFAVPAEPNRDILPTTLRLWRPVAELTSAAQN